MDSVPAGVGLTVLISGEPGIGKSRFARVLVDEHRSHDTRFFEFHGSPDHSNTAFYPLIGQLELTCGFQSNESRKGRQGKLKKHLLQAGLSLDDTFSALCALLSLPAPEGYHELDVDPSRRKEQIFAALERLLPRRAPETRHW